MPRSEDARPWWMTACAAFCLLTVVFLIPRDLFFEETRDVEVWLGFEVRGTAALLTAPLHWGIFAAGALGFWRGRPWILPCAAAYTFYVAFSHLVWSEASPNGHGWPAGLLQAAVLSVPGVLLLRAARGREARRARGILPAVRVQPLIAVRDVEASSRFYQALLDAASGHGGAEYERIVRDGRLLLQLHHWDVHEHPHLGDPDSRPCGNGVLLWFQVDDFDAAVGRAERLRAEVLEKPHENPRAGHREVWIRDPDGYVVVLSSRAEDRGPGP